MASVALRALPVFTPARVPYALVGVGDCAYDVEDSADNYAFGLLFGLPDDPRYAAGVVFGAVCFG